MKELVVISGKGGTGKTSLVASFAALSKDKVLADCDVDAADLHLVMDPCVRHREPFEGGKKAKIVAEHCTGCGEWKTVCRFDAVIADGQVNGVDQFRIDPIACEGCGVCTLVCPADAIEFKKAVNGEWFVSETRHGPMVHARLGIAESNDSQGASEGYSRKAWIRFGSNRWPAGNWMSSDSVGHRNRSGTGCDRADIVRPPRF